MYKVFITLILALYIITCSGQINLNNPVFSQINSGNGLTSDFITQCIKDKQGFVWISTTNGLNRYDGHNIKSYFHNPNQPNSICDNHISAMAIDHKNRLWLGGFNKGISCMNLSTGIIKNYLVEKNCTIKKNEYITSIYCDNKGKIWITTWGGGLYMFEESKNDFKPYLHKDGDSTSLYNNEVKYITQDKKGTYWVGLWAKGNKSYHSGVYQFNKDNNQFTDVINLIPNKKLVTDKVKAILKFVHSIYCDKKGNLWISGFQGCARINIEKNELDVYHDKNPNPKFNLETKEIRFVFEYNNQILLCSPLGGIYSLNEKYEVEKLIANDPSNEKSLSNNSIIHLMADNQNTLFISTVSGGVNMIQSANHELEFIPNQTISNKLSSINKLTCISNIDSHRWLLGGTKFLGIYNSKNNMSKILSEDKSIEYIKGFKLKSSSDLVYLSSNKKFEEFNFKSSQFSNFNFKELTYDNKHEFESINSAIHWNGDTFLLTHEYSGLMRYIKSLKSYYQYPIDLKNIAFISSVLKIDPQHVLIGYRDGIIKYNIYNHKITPLVHSKFDSKVGKANSVSNIYRDSKNRIWFTSDSGLALLHYPKIGYTQYTIKPKLTKLYHMVEDGHGNLWLNSNYKIYNFNTTTTQFKQVSSSKIKNNPFCSYQMEYNKYNGEIYIGSEGGIYKVNTDLFYDTSQLFPIKLIDLNYRNKDTIIEQSLLGLNQISLPYNANLIQISISNFDYLKSKENRLVYKLEGFDNEWRELGQSGRLEFNSLMPGDYTLRLKYKGLEEKHHTETQLEIQVKPPFWKTIWFYLAAVITIVLTAISWTKYKTKKLESQKIELESKVNDRTKELKTEKEKSDNLLLNILPKEIAEELKDKGETTAKQYSSATVLFTDFVNFTGISSELSPSELVGLIDLYFREFDRIMEKYNIEKIKTIGDAYMAVAGVHSNELDHAERTIYAAQEILDFVKHKQSKFEIRIGIHSGPIVAGVVGVKKFAYDIWGDTVNVASRMESNGLPMHINISQATYDLVKTQFDFIHRGKVEVKNKGELDMYYL